MNKIARLIFELESHINILRLGALAKASATRIEAFIPLCS
jgi:hypothetical protein